MYKNNSAKTHKMIKEAKQSSWHNYVGKINSNTKPKENMTLSSKYWGKNNSHSLKHLINNTKITNNIWQTTQLRTLPKNQNQKFQAIKQNGEEKSNSKQETHLQFIITETQESLNKSHNLAVRSDEIHYQFLK